MSSSSLHCRGRRSEPVNADDEAEAVRERYKRRHGNTPPCVSRAPLRLIPRHHDGWDHRARRSQAGKRKCDEHLM
jgi:hypothetical protein